MAALQVREVVARVPSHKAQIMKNLIVVSLLLLSTSISSQESIDTLLEKYNKQTVPYIRVSELKDNLESYLILDTRRKEEYDVSHLPGAIWVSEKMDDEIYAFAKAQKDQPIVVYCSVGVRSEDFGEQLQKRGFTNVHNLHGSIFSWKDAALPIENNKGQATDSVHVYSKVWGKYLQNGIKVSKLD